MKRLLLTLLFLLFSTVAQAAQVFAVCTVTCTWDNSSTAMWSVSSGGASGAAAPTSAEDVVLDAATCIGGVTCTITVNANLSVRTLTMGACTASTTGCILDFSVNNNNITFAAATGTVLSLTGGGTRTLRMGSGNWTFSQTGGTMITALSSTGLTLTPGTSTIVTNHTNSVNTVTFHTGAGKTWGNLTINANANKGNLNITDSTTTFANVTVTGPNYIDYGGGSTNTITSLTIVGGSPSKLVSFISPQWSISGTGGGNWVWFHDANCTGGGTLTFTNSFNAGNAGSSGCTATVPVISGGGACILGGWLLWRDMPGRLNDNFPAWLDKAA